MFEPKLPGFSAFLVLGLGIGALLTNEAMDTAVYFLAFALDSFRYVKR